MSELRRQVARPERVLLVAPSLMYGVFLVGVITFLVTPVQGVFRPVSALIVGFVAWLLAWRWSAREPHVETVLGEWARQLGIGGSGFPSVGTFNTWRLPGRHYER
jgi:hypothetical protein